MYRARGTHIRGKKFLVCYDRFDHLFMYACQRGIHRICKTPDIIELGPVIDLMHKNNMPIQSVNLCLIFNT